MNTSNVNAAEIEKFSQHAPEWWNEQGPLKTLHQINPTRVQWIAQHAQLAGVKTLDIGCGGGLPDFLQVPQELGILHLTA